MNDLRLRFFSIVVAYRYILSNPLRLVNSQKIPVNKQVGENEFIARVNGMYIGRICDWGIGGKVQFYSHHI